MPIAQQYYLNSPSLSSATAVFANSSLSVLAPDGYYSDGAITRQQVGGVLLPVVPCPSCGVSCDLPEQTAGSDRGIYRATINALYGVGAVVIKFTPEDVPDGVQAVYNGNIYNTLSSNTYGYLGGTPGLPVYIGNSGLDCGLVAGSPYLLAEFEYDGVTSSFVPLGTNQWVTIAGGQMSLSPGDPGSCYMIIPKTNSAITDIDLTMILACDGSVCKFDIDCPILLPKYFSTALHAGPILYKCDSVTDQTYYVFSVNSTYPVLGLHDMVFSDPNGEFPLANGWYTAPIHCPSPNDSYQVTNGVITNFANICSTGTLEITGEDNYSGCEAGVVNGVISVDWEPVPISIFSGNIPFATVTYNIDPGVYKIKLTANVSAGAVDCPPLKMELIITDPYGTNTYTQIVSPPNASQTYTLTHTIYTLAGGAYNVSGVLSNV
jgi:hypothetical protein